MHGLFVLDNLLRGKTVDFCILMSSNVSVLGGLKSAAYTAANVFLDAFAQKNAREGDLPWMSSNWDRWGYLEELSAERAAGYAKSIVDLAMDLEEAVEAFRRLLSIDPVPQIVVSTGDLNARLGQWIELEGLKEQEGSDQADSSALHARPALESAYVAPRNQAEQALVEIWGEILGIGKIGINDNFFELGGDSILSIQIIAKAKKAGLRLTTNEIFERPTIMQLAKTVGVVESFEVEQGVITGEVPLTPIQHWFFEQGVSNPQYFTLLLTLEARRDLDSVLLEKAAQQLIVHHDALRLRYVQKGARWRQVNADVGDAVPFERIDLSTLSAAEQKERDGERGE